MKQSIIVRPQTSLIEERPAPAVGPDDVLVQVKACGVCASELHGWQGDSAAYPREYGHEVAGVVVEVGSAVAEFRPGMAVTGLFGKGFAEFTRAPQKYVARIPDSLTFEQALGEPLACVMSGVRRARIDLGDTVAIIGLGFMGLLTLQAVRLRGPARIIAVDPRPEALELARRFGADELLKPDDVPEALKLTQWSQLGKGHGVDVAVEASGTQTGLTLAGEMAREHGLLSLVGWQQGGLRLVDMELWNWKALDVLNAHERRLDYLMDCMRRGLALVAHGNLDLGALVSHHFSLNEVDDAFRALRDKPEGFVKAVITLS
ncbi:MAG: alcohol dehydrogenase catalytic domain-containing protein [Caldilinea sp.]